MSESQNNNKDNNSSKKTKEQEQQEREFVYQTGGSTQEMQQIVAGPVSPLGHPGATEATEAAKAELDIDHAISEQKALRGATNKTKWVGGGPQNTQTQASGGGQLGSGRVVPEKEKQELPNTNTSTNTNKEANKK